MRTRSVGNKLRFPIIILLFVGIPFLLLTCPMHYDNTTQYDYDPVESITDFESIKYLPPSDPEVLRYITFNHVFQPSLLPYNLNHPEKDPSEYADVLKELFKGKKNGVFIECGANDGEFLCNTLVLERDHGWTGLLIEANPTMVSKLLNKNRKATVIDVCLSSTDQPQKLQFLDRIGSLDWEKGSGKVQPDVNHVPKYFQPQNYNAVGLVECFPLFSIMAATNITDVDYFSLDVEGNEFQILKRIPYYKLNFKVIHVEHWLAPEGKWAIQNFMNSKGFRKYNETQSDFIFVKKGIKAF